METRRFLTLLIFLLLVATELYADEPIDVQILSSKGEYYKALLTYDRLPKRRITTEATIAAAKSAWALSLPERAIAEFERVLQNSKLDGTERGRIFLSRGIIEFQEGRYQVASLYGEKAAKQIAVAGPLRAKALLLHGESLARLGNYGSAEENLIQALQESSEEDEAEIRYQLGDSLMKLNKFKEAEEHLQAVPVGHDRTPLAIRKLGEIALTLRNADQALFWLTKGRAEYPDAFLDSWVDYALSQAAMGKEDFDLARQFKEVANTKFAPSDFWLSMLNASFEVGQWQSRNSGAGGAMTLKGNTTQILDYDSLQEAFLLFSEASTRLESKYQNLVEETKVLRETLRQKDIEIKRQERLAMLGETAAAIAHEVRNPLGAIKLFVSLLRQDTADRPDSLKLIDQVDISIAALDHVVSNILQFSKEKKIVFAPVNAHSIIQEQLLSFPRSDANQAQFHLELAGTPYILGNESSLRQVIYNLILNSLQATDYRGKISIRTTDEQDGSLRIEIADSGAGIPEEVITKLFEPFVTTKNEGTGLGLAIVKQIIEQHHGQIAAHNDKGAVFTITIPRSYKES